MRARVAHIGGVPGRRVTNGVELGTGTRSFEQCARPRRLYVRDYGVIGIENRSLITPTVDEIAVSPQGKVSTPRIVCTVLR